MRNNKFEAVLFDLDGTLINSEGLHDSSTLQVAKEHGVDLSNFDFTKWMGCSFEDMYAKDLHRFFNGLDFRQVNDMCLNKFKENFNDSHCFAGVFDKVKYLYDNKVKLACVTNSEKRLANFSLDYINIRGFFDVIITSDDLPKERRKPQADPYIMAYEKLNLRSEQCLAVEDSFTGLSSAKAAGLTTIGLKTTNSIEQIAAKADYLFNELQDINFDDFMKYGC